MVFISDKRFSSDEAKLKASKIEELNKKGLLRLKRKGFPDKRIADLLNVDEVEIRDLGQLIKFIRLLKELIHVLQNLKAQQTIYIQLMISRMNLLNQKIRK